MLEAAFERLCRGLLDPKSITFRPWGQDWQDLEGSIDAHIPYIDRGYMPLFAGEYELAGTNLTTLAEPNPYLRIEGGEHAATEEVIRLLEGARQAQGCDSAGVEMWGLTHIYYLAADGLLRSGWFLREKLLWVTGTVTYHPILEADFSFFWSQDPAFQLRLGYHTRLWSEYDDPVPMDDPSEWPKKENTSAARANCAMLAERVAAFFSDFSGTTLTWVQESEHPPPIQNMLVAELENRIGPRGVPRVL